MTASQRVMPGFYMGHTGYGIPANRDVLTFRDLPVNSYDEARAIHDALLALANTRQDSFRARFTGDGIVMTKQARGNVKIAEITNPYENEIDQLPWMQEHPGYEIILYWTPIVRYYPDGTFSVDNGGYNTQTTSRRVNQFTPRNRYFWHVDGQLCCVLDEDDDIEPDFVRYGRPLKRCTHDVRLTAKKEVVA